MPVDKHEVVHVSAALFGEDGVWGGGERYALELARAQAKHRPTRLVTFGQNPRRFNDGPLSIVVLRPRGYFAGNFTNPITEKLIPELRTARIVHLHQIYTGLSDWSAICCKILERPVVASDLGALARNLEGRFSRESVIQRHLALSEFAALHNPQWKGRTVIIGGGVDDRFLAPHGSRRTTNVVYVGRLMPYKGADVLIRAVPDDVPLHLYGRPYDDRYFGLLKEFAVEKNVTFHLEASDDEVLDALRTARMAVLPSRTVTIFGGEVPKVELFGLALAEAMACGTPVICSDAGSLPEVVADEVTGLVVPPGDIKSMRAAIERLLRDDRGWEAMSIAARNRVLENFTWDRVALRCFEVYDDPTLSPAPRSFSTPALRDLLRPPSRLERWFSREVQTRA